MEISYYQAEVLKFLAENKFTNQRNLAREVKHSLGSVNSSIKDLIELGYIDNDCNLNEKANVIIESQSPKRAIILAAGGGIRMVPINKEIPKALIEIHNETMIERIINQLHDVGIYEIYIIVGFMKEKLEFLIDEYNVKLIVNTEYSSRENLYSLLLALNHIDNAYIIPCDIWSKTNPFNKTELFSWYMVTEAEDYKSDIRINRNMDLVFTKKRQGNKKTGIAYLTYEDAKNVKRNLKALINEDYGNEKFWEEALLDKKRNKYVIKGRLVDSDNIVGINTYEQLRSIDSNSKNLDTTAINIITDIFNIKSTEIVNISVLKKGMTNRSFIFSCGGKKYIMRIPGEGTGKLINRFDEAEVYEKIKNRGLCDNLIYINPENGYKISSFVDNVRTCDTKNEQDVKMCIDKLKEFHNMNLKVNHEFNIYNQIEFYESLWNGNESSFRDYKKTKDNVYSLKQYIDSIDKNICLTHIDAVPDNFLISDNRVQLIDWEYAGMQDPHIDIAMFCVYSMYDKYEIDNIMRLYFKDEINVKIKAKIYAYISQCGLLWSNWAEYKRTLGVEFGEYSLKQYRYAKEYYCYAKNLINGEINLDERN